MNTTKVDFAEIERQFQAEDLNFTVTRADQVPPTYRSITDEWLTNVFCAKAPGAQVISHSLDETRRRHVQPAADIPPL